MKQTRWILLVLLVTPLLAGCDRGEPGAMAADGEPANVVVTAPVVQPDVARFPAEVRAARKADLATRMAGTIVRVNVDVGSRVTRGDLLVLLDAVDVEARISRAGAAERQARQWHDRIQSLEADGAATPQELDDAVARLEMATASLTETEAQLSYAVLRAPFSGVITRRFAEPGDLATPGFSVLTIVAEGSIKIVADLPGELERSLKTGDPLRVVDPASGLSHEASVTRISPALDRASRRFRLEAHLAEDSGARLLPGTFVRLELEGETPQGRWIPQDALVRRGQLTGVFTLDGEELRLNWIRAGLRRGSEIEVLAGLPGDASVVRRPVSNLVDGQPVGTVTRDAAATTEGAGG